MKYEPGELKVVVYDADGNRAGEKVVRTASKPKKLLLEAWTQADGSLKADGGHGVHHSLPHRRPRHAHPRGS